MVSRQRSTMTILAALVLPRGFKEGHPDTVTCSNSNPSGCPMQKSVPFFRTTRAPTVSRAMTRWIVRSDRRLNFVLADFETDASARFRKGIDGGLNILTGRTTTVQQPGVSSVSGGNTVRQS